MPQIKLFRLALIFLYVLSAVELFLGFYLEDNLPLLLQEYIASDQLPDDEEKIHLMLAMGATIILSTITLVGLWMFKAWGRVLNCIIILVVIVIYPLLGPQVLNEWEALFSYLSSVLEGVLLLWMFTGDINDRFNYKKKI